MNAKPRKKKEAEPEPIKLTNDTPDEEAESYDWAMIGIVAVALLLLIFAVTRPAKQSLEVTGPPVTIEQQQGPGKTYKEPGSARDIFNENFSR